MAADGEEKWVVAPEGVSFTKEEIWERVYFQEQYFDSEIVMCRGSEQLRNKAVARAYVETVDRTIQVAKALNVPVLNMHMNLGKNFAHFVRSQLVILVLKYVLIENTDGYREYEKFILTNSEKLCHFHVQDSIGKKDHMTLGTGEIDLVQRLNIAKDCQCRCVVETKTIQALNKSVLWVRLAAHVSYG